MVRLFSLTNLAGSTSSRVRVATPISLSFTYNTVTNNGFSVNNVVQITANTNITGTFQNNIITSNSGNNYYAVSMNSASLTFSNNIFSNPGLAGELLYTSGASMNAPNNYWGTELDTTISTRVSKMKILLLVLFWLHSIQIYNLICIVLSA